MYPMDPQFYDFNPAADLNADKQNILRQMSDMFYGISLTTIRGICEECMWNVDFCIDKLITKDGDSDRGQHTQPMNTTPATVSFSSVLQQSTSGAVPKALQSKQSSQELPPVYGNVYDNIENGYKVLILMRGAPGSGKSHLAKSIVNKLMPGRDWKDFILSADDFFFDSLGRYKYALDRLEDAHRYCQTRAREKATLGWSPIIIDNTNIQLWEMLPYVQAAVQNGYLVELMEPVTPWKNSAAKLASKNAHNVQKHKIQRMLDNYEIGTTNDVIMLLKQTKYTVSLPQLRTYPPPPIVQLQPAPPQTPNRIPTPTQSTNDNNEMEADPNHTITEQMQIEREPSSSPVPFAESSNNVWSSYDTPTKVKESPIPKLPRQYQRNRQQPQEVMSKEATIENIPENVATFEQEAANFWGIPLTPTKNIKSFESDETPTQLFPAVPVVWQAYEQEAPNFWGVPVTTASTNMEPMNTDQNESCGLLQLLKEGVKSINVPKTYTTDDSEVVSNTFERHRVGCENENQSFVALRQIYPNKPTADLWDLFVKCSGSVDWAVDILLKDDDSVSYEADLIENCDNYDCGCDNPMKDNGSVANIPLPEVNVKPQRTKSARNRAVPPTAEILEVKEAVEKSFVLGDEYYSSHVKKIRNKRNAIEDPSDRKTFIDVEVQTEVDENDTISEEAADASEILEINLGEDLIGQLTGIFKTETPTLTIPEKYKTNVFMPKSLAREIYILWMESMYNQIEEQRQCTLKEDEEFARLLKHPKYENCKQPPENIKELLDMEFAWMIYKTDQEELRAAATQHQHPNDLASHLTRMKLCEIFPSIPRETLLDILAAHNNKFSDTVEVLKSSIQPATIDHQVSAKVLIEKAINENEKLNKEAEKQQEQKFNNISHSSSFKQIHSISQQEDSTPRKRSMSPDEAKRLALKEFEETRNYAAHHCQLRAECYQKAKDAIQRGNSGVAVYYSQIANLHKKKIDIYNHRAANCIMEVHDLTQNNPDFIDLHYLHVIEAIACLDIFVDKHIAKLRSIFRSFKYVFIITGRGLHSTGGVSTIKTKVKSRLKERNLKWSEVNPGLLKVKIFSASKYAKNL